MLRKLTENDKAIILDFAYLRERENLFVIGSFDLKNPFAINHYYGFFRKELLVGVAMFSGEWGSVTVNAEEEELRALVDQVVEDGHEIKFVPCFKRYADPIIAQLKTHGISPKKVDEEKVYTLKSEDFHDFSTGGELQPTLADRAEIVLVDHIVSNEHAPNGPTQREIERTLPERFWIVKEEGKIVAKACIHGYSRNYFQIGGVGTLPEYRGKGLAKQVVSALIKHYFAQGIGTALLFTSNQNTAAQAVYFTLGFKVVDEFVIAEF